MPSGSNLARGLLFETCLVDTSRIGSVGISTVCGIFLTGSFNGVGVGVDLSLVSLNVFVRSTIAPDFFRLIGSPVIKEASFPHLATFTLAFFFRSCGGGRFMGS